MTIEKVTSFLGFPVGREELQPGEFTFFVDSGVVAVEVSGRRLNVVEVNSSSKITVHRSLWLPWAVARGYLPAIFPYSFKEEEINQSHIGSHGIISKSIEWKPNNL
jgi:hypothetical protein